MDGSGVERAEIGGGGGGAEAAAAAVAARGGSMPEPVAAMMEGSALRSSHSMVSPSEWWPNSRVNWNIRAAQTAGIRTRHPLPFTFPWRSLEEEDEFRLERMRLLLDEEEEGEDIITAASEAELQGIDSDEYPMISEKIN